ncbi:carbon-nitrogen hydrolase family protein [Rhizobacter sp. Root1221]|uniref:carbon-nitrogen hydrolase family protein n=1 Tax=Rhizobacter sp. Root1221 TaxID=1736433 RepID=UPI0009E9867B|nr:carbon-nitrogen hydrolase family protein [Rhizobacter sp. Root1221]
MLIAALQMVSTPDVARNLERAGALIAEAAQAGARIVALPEYFCLMGHSDQDKIALAETPGDGPIQAALAAAARTHGVWVIGGTLPLRAAVPGRVLNSCNVFAPDGTLAARYDKMHLFRYDNGRERYDEGAVLDAGSQPVAFEAEGLRVGLSICYDLRFPELYRALTVPPCDLLAVPSAFTHTTGRAHWELLLRARAVENQCYVIAPAQGGLHENGRRTFGHSLVADPWGEVLAMREEGEGVVLATLSRERIQGVRAQLPALSHRRAAFDGPVTDGRTSSGVPATT